MQPENSFLERFVCYEEESLTARHDDSSFVDCEDLDTLTSQSEEPVKACVLSNLLTDS